MLPFHGLICCLKACDWISPLFLGLDFSYFIRLSAFMISAALIGGEAGLTVVTQCSVITHHSTEEGLNVRDGTEMTVLVHLV